MLVLLLLKLVLSVTFCACSDWFWEHADDTCSEPAMYVVFAGNNEPSFLTKNEKNRKQK